jgi:hypothetical protein
MNKSRWVVTYMKDGVRQHAYFDTKNEAYKGILRVRDQGGTHLFVGKVNMVDKIVINRRAVEILLLITACILWGIVIWKLFQLF